MTDLPIRPVGNQVEGGLPLFAPPIKVRGQQRRCGSCTACCTLVAVQLPVGEKPAGVPCRYLHPEGRGCGIYANRPRVCMSWSCRWLFDPETRDLERPDHGGYVICPDLQTIFMDGDPISVMQISLDPKRPDAHRDPVLRKYLRSVFDRFAVPALVRIDEGTVGGNGFLLIPLPDGEWAECKSEAVEQSEMDRRLTEIGRRQ